MLRTWKVVASTSGEHHNDWRGLSSVRRDNSGPCGQVVVESFFACGTEQNDRVVHPIVALLDDCTRLLQHREPGTLCTDVSSAELRWSGVTRRKYDFESTPSQASQSSALSYIFV